MTIQRLRQLARQRLEKINVRDGKPIPPTDEEYVAFVRPAERETPSFVVQRVSFGIAGVPRVVLGTTIVFGRTVDSEEIELPAEGALAEAEPGDTVELHLVKMSRQGDS